MKTISVKISSEVPIEIYDKLVLRAHDIGVSKDTVILNALKQYLNEHTDAHDYGDDYLFGPVNTAEYKELL